MLFKSCKDIFLKIIKNKKIVFILNSSITKERNHRKNENMFFEIYIE